jgi:hypothetical protein
MKQAALIFLLALALAACKRKFTCHCFSITSSGQTLNEKEFTVKDKNEKNAYLQCSNEYLNMGLAVDTVKCDVKQQ